MCTCLHTRLCALHQRNIPAVLEQAVAVLGSAACLCESVVHAWQRCARLGLAYQAAALPTPAGTLRYRAAPTHAPPLPRTWCRHGVLPCEPATPGQPPDCAATHAHPRCRRTHKPFRLVCEYGVTSSHTPWLDYEPGSAWGHTRSPALSVDSSAVIDRPSGPSCADMGWPSEAETPLIRSSSCWAAAASLPFQDCGGHTARRKLRGQTGARGAAPGPHRLLARKGQEHEQSRGEPGLGVTVRQRPLPLPGHGRKTGGPRRFSTHPRSSVPCKVGQRLQNLYRSSRSYVSAREAAPRQRCTAGGTVSVLVSRTVA